MCKVCTGTRGKGVVTGSPTYIYYIYLDMFLMVGIIGISLPFQQKHDPIQQVVWPWLFVVGGETTSLQNM